MQLKNMSIVIVEFKNNDSNRDQNIEMLWSCMCLVRSFKDFPLVWKLNLKFLESIANYCNIKEMDHLLQQKFLDASLDMTSKKSVLICEKETYPVDLVNLQ
jgi:hypothetical protein